MPLKKIITKAQVLSAMKHTLSNRAASRYLGCSYNHYKSYAKLYNDEDGRTLFDVHFNQRGKGIKKFLGGDADNTPLMDIIEGKVSVDSFSIDKLKARLIKDAFLKEECKKCSFSERRVVDFKVPLILNFKDGNKKNWQLENMEFNCYNCQFLYIGNVYSDEQLKAMEDYHSYRTASIMEDVTWDLDETQVEHLKELGLWGSKDDEDDELNLISYK
jgi:hypothetical protein